MFIVWEHPPPCIVCVRNYIIDSNIQSGQEVVDQTKLESFCSMSITSLYEKIRMIFVLFGHPVLVTALPSKETTRLLVN